MQGSALCKKFSYIDRIDLTTAHKIADKKLMKKLYGDTLELSASRFEDFSKCPFMYFCKTGLKLYPLPKMDLNPINQGNIMHMCMKDIFEENRGEKFLNMTTDDLTASIKKSVDGYIAKNLSGKFAKKKSFGFYLDIMNDTLLTALTHMQEEQRVSRFVPSDFEYPVGVKGSVKNSTVTPVIIECGEGLKVNFTGTADRVDEFTDENGVIYIRILDYKTGVKDFMKEQLALGINMQMFFYLFALTDEKGGRYGGCVPAGALYIPVKYPKSADDRMADETSAAKCIDDTMKMQGAVLDSPLIINAMEEDCRGRFIPVTFKKDGTVSAKSSVIDIGTMEKIKALAIKQIEDMGMAVYSGDFPASPLESKKYKCTIPCGFCDYREICGNYPDPVPRDISDIDFEINGERSENMPSVTWTKEQLDAIEAKDRAIVVSAAAGSGKTAVLVEKLLRILSDREDPVPADRIAVVTFTNDAAAQMKQRLTSALAAAAELEPENEWLTAQQALIPSAKISTIHSFCFSLIREMRAALTLTLLSGCLTLRRTMLSPQRQRKMSLTTGSTAAPMT